MHSLFHRIQGRLSLLDNRASSSFHILYTADWVVMVVCAVAQAQKLPDIKIVSLDWLLDSANDGKVLDEDQYSFANKNRDKAAPSSQPATGKKRARASTPGEDDPQQTTPPDGKEDDEPPVKRQKDGQKAKADSALSVPVDEGCNLACKGTAHYPIRHCHNLCKSLAPRVHRYRWHYLRRGPQSNERRA